MSTNKMSKDFHNTVDNLLDDTKSTEVVVHLAYHENIGDNDIFIPVKAYDECDMGDVNDILDTVVEKIQELKEKNIDFKFSDTDTTQEYVKYIKEKV